MKLKEYLTEEKEWELSHRSGKSKIKTTIAPENRSFKNLPTDSKNKPKIHFKEWLGIEGKGNYGKAANGKWYGWSHRAIYGFKEGEKIKGDSMGKRRSTDADFIIKDDKHAMEVAKIFADNVS